MGPINYFEGLGFGRAMDRPMQVAGQAQALRANEQGMDIRQQQADMQRTQFEQQQAMLPQQQAQLQQQAQRQQLAEASGVLYGALQSGQTDRAAQMAAQYEPLFKSLDPTFDAEQFALMASTPEGLQQLNTELLQLTQVLAGPEQTARFGAQQARPETQNAPPADVAKFEYWKQMNPDATPEQQRQMFDRIINPYERALATAQGAGQGRVVTEQELNPVRAEGKTQETRALEQEKRQQALLQAGIDAADASGNLMRSIELLDQVKTGGINRASLAAKRFFGVEGADEAELSANLGRAVLAQLKPIFGAQFTAAEGERLEKIEANFGKSTEGNKRLLRELLDTNLRAARRAQSIAERTGDETTLAVIEPIIKQIEDFKSGKRGNQGADWFFGDNEQPAQQGAAPKVIGRFQVEVE
jgi:hypothetical protein